MITKKIRVPFDQAGDFFVDLELEEGGENGDGEKATKAGELVFAVKRPKGKDRLELANEYGVEDEDAEKKGPGDLDRDIFLRFAVSVAGLDDLLRLQGYVGPPVGEEISSDVYDELLDSWAIDVVVDEVQKMVSAGSESRRLGKSERKRAT